MRDSGSSYWKRLTKRRLSRRRLLTGAAGVGAGLAALSLVGCEEEEEAALATPTPSPAATPTPAGAAIPIPPVKPWDPATSRGGITRWFGYEPLPLDTVDPHQTQFGPTYSVHGAVFSKVLKYEDIFHGIMDTDLAEAMPETVDKLTYIIKIRPNVRFHDTETIRKNYPQVAGRQLTAEDVKYSIERQLNKESPKSALYYRAYQWETVDKIEVVDPLTLRITTKRPTAPFLHYLADTNAFIIAKELVDPQKDDMNSTDKMIGSGPFLLDKYVPLTVIVCLRNPDWFARDDLADQGLADRPIMDGFQANWTPQDDTTVEMAFKSKQVDGCGYVDPANVQRIAAETGADIDTTVSTGWVNSRLLLNDSPAVTTPFKDLRLRKAISIAVDRNRMGQQMYRGPYSILCPPVSLAITRWALPLEELIKKPGFRFGRQEREEDLAEAKRLWEAGGGPTIGPVTIVYSGIPDYVRDYFPQLQSTLKAALGLELRGELDPTGATAIAQGWLEKRLVMSFSYDNGWIDLDDWLYPYFHSTGSKNSFSLSDPELDRMLDDQRAEFDYERRRQIGLDIQNYLLDEVVARLDFVAPISLSTEWPYKRNRKPTPWFGSTFHVANMWLDKNHPTYQGRPP